MDCMRTTSSSPPRSTTYSLAQPRSERVLVSCDFFSSAFVSVNSLKTDRTFAKFSISSTAPSHVVTTKCWRSCRNGRQLHELTPLLKRCVYMFPRSTVETVGRGTSLLVAHLRHMGALDGLSGLRSDPNHSRKGARMFAICRAISLSRGIQSSFPHIILRTM